MALINGRTFIIEILSQIEIIDQAAETLLMRDIPMNLYITEFQTQYKKQKAEIDSLETKKTNYISQLLTENSAARAIIETLATEKENDVLNLVCNKFFPL